MRTLVTMETTAEYDLVDPGTRTDVLKRYFGEPHAAWDSDYLDPGEVECVRRVTIRSAETNTIEIDREESVVWVTYTVSLDIEYDSHLLEYFGASVEDMVRAGCQIRFPVDERVVEIADKESTLVLR